MLFKGIGRTFSTENDQQYETIGAFWDGLAAKYGRENLQGLGYGWTDRMTAFLERERKQWTCSACGGVICVHTGVCVGCGWQYAGSMEH